MSGIIIAKSIGASSSGSSDSDWVDGGIRLKTTSSVSISDENIFADEKGSDVYFYVSGSSSNKSLFGGDVHVSGTLTAEGGLSGSLTKLPDGTSYLIAGPGISITTQSNGAVFIESTVVVPTLPTYVDFEVPDGVKNGTNNVFTLDNAPFPTSSLKVVLRGLTRQENCDYIISGSTIDFLTASGAAVPKATDAFFTYYRY